MKKHEMFKHIVAIRTAKNGNVYACLLYTSPSPRD